MSAVSSRTVLVTGASSGLGKAIAERLVAEGHQVFGTSRKWQIGIKDGLHTLPMDVLDEGSIKKAIDHVIAGAGCIDVLINNAGIGIQGAVEDVTADEAQRAFDTNFLGLHRVVRAVLPAMRSMKSGMIINISSIAANMGLPYRAFYCASKAAVDRYSEALQIELKDWNIAVCCVEPGDFRSNIEGSRIRPAQVSEAHANGYERCMRKLDEQMRHAPEPDAIVRRVATLVSKGKGRFRYRVGAPLERLSVHLRYFLPSSVFQGLLKRFSE